MTPGKQKLVIAALFVVFLCMIPLLIFYSMGYRLRVELKLVQTGGIYISNEEPDAVLYINGKEIKRSGVIIQNLLIQDLKPDVYTVRFEKENCTPWTKKVPVKAKRVSVCYPLLLPQEIKPVEIKKYIPAEKKDLKTKNTRHTVNDEYIEVNKLFKKAAMHSAAIFPGSLQREVLKPGKNLKMQGRVLLGLEKNRIYVTWTGKKKNMPFFINTMKRKQVFTSLERITHFDFYPGRSDSFLARLAGGNLVAVEMDTRFGENISTVLLKRCDRFIVHNLTLYYYSGSRLYKYDL
ncbi:MAG: hypothetical protein JXA07_06740 [Spirochaetes bacterium]|nr:hypothetical protein [Spirochaetota bacterium]